MVDLATMAEEPASQSPPTAAPLGSSVIPMVNKLQDIFAQLGSQSTIDLPQVAVVGSQSSGKSSVLEALVGRDFLPRGNEICTRRPLVLQLVQTKRKGDGSEEEWGEFLHRPDKRYYDFSEIRREIEAVTAKEAGDNKGVSDKQIRLKIFSPTVLDITLVDLPGITKVPVGDQPTDIEAKIRTMIMSYIKKPSCLILAVTAANADLANSDALQIAGIADPDGYRTIGIITKLDIMDRGTDARNLLLGKVIPLRLGYIGVVNRCQEDINLNRTIKDALAAEEKFFRSHPVYNSLADRCGIPQLAKKLNHILVQHIKGILPVLKSRISDTLVSVAKEHASYGEITESKGVDPCEDLTDDDIRTAIQNACGSNAALFVPVIPFEVLVRRQIARLLYPSLQCARFIYDELIKISHRCLANELQRFPVLRKRMDEVIGNFLRDGLEPSETMVGHLIEMEMDYINTSHPNFIGGTKAVEVAQQQLKSSRANPAISRPKGVRQVANAETIVTSGNPGRSSWGISSIFGGSNSSRFSSEKTATSMEYMDGDYGSDYLSNSLSVIHLQEPPEMLRPSDTPSEQESIEIAVIKLLLRSYYNIVRKNIEDLVPKTIMHFLVQHTKRELHNVLIKKLYRENLFEEMLQEPDEISVKRKQTRDTLRVLQQAFRTLEEMPLEAESVERGQSSGSDTTGLPKMRGFPLSSSIYAAGNSSNGFYAGSPNNHKSRKSSLSSSHSGELQSHYYPMADSNGRGGGYMPSLYPSVD
ncbi:Dynamin-related protein 3A [Linum grandiflorum]